MGKKDKNCLGRSLIKDRFGSNKGRKTVANNTLLHTTEIQDGYDWGRLNLQSVTEESSFQEFLSTAELAGTEFQAEKLNVTFVNPKVNVGLLTGAEKVKAEEEQIKNKDMLKIPRRPKWSAETTAEELQLQEREDFLSWRRKLAVLQDNEGLMLTPYEKNLEFWRQLWRVVERSDVVIQIVDARNPLLFRCEDLEQYVNEIGSEKLNLILLNKADFLTIEQRKVWADYFAGQGVRVAFFSAKLAAEEEKNEKEEVDKRDEIHESDTEDESAESDTNYDTTSEPSEYFDTTELRADIKELEKCVANAEQVLNKIGDAISYIVGTSLETAESSTENDDEKKEQSVSSSELNADNAVIINSSELLTRDGLISLFRNIHKGQKTTKGITTIGMVGYPNVGKSSTINALMTVKKVSVSATPGKTKHFQTLFLNEDILLCDCPGLVMPSFVFTKAEMVINGILPIDQMRDHVGPVNLVASLIPRHILEDKYGIMITKPMEGEDKNRNPTAEELLNAYGFNRGFMTANGQPDCPRSARYVLKDFVNGKLLYATAPPEVSQSEFHVFPARKNLVDRVLPPREQRAIRLGKESTANLEEDFFARNKTGAYPKGVVGKSSGLPNTLRESYTPNTMEKPWKKQNKHGNKKKKEKLRRVYANLDQH